MRTARERAFLRLFRRRLWRLHERLASWDYSRPANNDALNWIKAEIAALEWLLNLLDPNMLFAPIGRPLSAADSTLPSFIESHS